MKELPILFTNKDECCGCSACCEICPQSAITMSEDGEGFDYMKDAVKLELVNNFPLDKDFIMEYKVLK